MPTPLQPGDHITLHLDSLAAGGEAVGRHEGMAVFVMWGCPGDDAEIEITEIADRFARGVVRKVITPSPDRVTAPCPHFGYCGGCQVQHIAYPAQLRHKAQIVRDAVSRIAGLASLEIADTWGMDDPWHYRNRVEYHAGADESGAFCLGFTRTHTHDVFPLQKCALQHPISERIRTTLLDLVRRPAQGPPAVIAREAGGRQSPDDRGNLAVSDGVSGFSIPKPDDPTASLLDLDILVSFSSSQAIATLVCDGRPEFLRPLAEALMQRAPGLIGVSAARSRGRLAAHRSPSESIVGKSFITERLGDSAYRVSPDAFFQANPLQAARMLDLVKQWVFADRVDGVLDLYSGVGTFLLPLARRAHHAVAVEENDAALTDLRASVRQWRLGNVNYYEGKVERVLPRLAQRGWKTDVIVIDPPRKGAGPAVCAAAAKLGPRRIILISCHPATLARDLKSLTEHGYVPRLIQPIDMFPQTHHIEAICLCERR